MDSAQLLSTVTSDTYFTAADWVTGTADVNVRLIPGELPSVFLTSRAPPGGMCYARLRQHLMATRGEDLRVVCLDPIALRDVVVELLRAGLRPGRVAPPLLSALQFDRLV